MIAASLHPTKSQGLSSQVVGNWGDYVQIKSTQINKCSFLCEGKTGVSCREKTSQNRVENKQTKTTGKICIRNHMILSAIWNK